MAERPAVPLFTIGGFLGAGKTTLVNHILHRAEGQRIVVFVNDFGAINIDYDLIESADTDRVSLANGCVCCSLNDDLITSIIAFCDDDPPDAFIIEASGVADPRALDQTIATLQNAGRIALGQRIYVIDVGAFGSLGYADTEEIVDHASACDLAVLNKFDLVDVTALKGVEQTLQRSAPRTAQMRARYCDVSVASLLNADPAQVDLSEVGFSHKDAADRFESMSITDVPPISEAAFMAVLERLKVTALRAKGVVYFDEDPQTPVRFDHVGQRATLKRLDRPEKAPLPTACFVAIGWRGSLEATDLQARLGRVVQPAA